MNAQDFYVGQTVLHFNGSRASKPQECQVTKVGRTNVQVLIFGREYAFRMESGQGVKDFTGYIRTPEQYAEQQRRAVVLTTLREEFGLALTAGAFSRHITAETWESVLETLRQASR